MKGLTIHEAKINSIKEVEDRDQEGIELRGQMEEFFFFHRVQELCSGVQHALGIGQCYLPCVSISILFPKRTV